MFCPLCFRKALIAQSPKARFVTMDKYLSYCAEKVKANEPRYGTSRWQYNVWNAEEQQYWVVHPDELAGRFSKWCSMMIGHDKCPHDCGEFKCACFCHEPVDLDPEMKVW